MQALRMRSHFHLSVRISLTIETRAHLKFQCYQPVRKPEFESHRTGLID